MMREGNGLPRLASPGGGGSRVDATFFSVSFVDLAALCGDDEGCEVGSRLDELLVIEV